jgi:PAS domain S-box-containing protein
MESLPNLLIVDDNKDYLEYLNICLTGLNINIILAQSGEEALEKSKDVELFLALLDIMMPTMNGFDLAVLLNEKRSSEKVPIIFFTALYMNDGHIHKGYDAGAVDYILKPLNRHILVSKVKVFLELYQQKRTIRDKAAELKSSQDALLRTFSLLSKSEELYRTLMDASPDAIVLTDLKGRITEVSRVGLELLGIQDRKAIAGQLFFQFVTAENKPALKDMIRTSQRQGIAQNVTLFLRKTDGSVYPGELSIALINGPDEQPFAYMIIIRDNTNRKQTEAKQFHNDRMASLGKMASGIAHEINQPLNIISMTMDNIILESMKEQALDKEYLKRKSDKIFENIVRIKNIIDHIKLFSRNQDNYLLSEFDVNLSISNAVGMLSEQFLHNGINLDVELMENTPRILGNTSRLEQVILNLLMNSKDALLEKQHKQNMQFDKAIVVRTYMEKGNIVIEVIDNGMGIPEEHLNQVFLPFFTTKDSDKGTGLGLSISSQIIKEMNGNIEIVCNQFNGATVKIVLENSNN